MVTAALWRKSDANSGLRASVFGKSKPKHCVKCDTRLEFVSSKGSSKRANEAFSLHRLQIPGNFDLEDYLIDSGSGSRIVGEASDSAAFSKDKFKRSVSVPLAQKSALKRVRSGCLRGL
jgi:hypothetical protein